MSEQVTFEQDVWRHLLLDDENFEPQTAPEEFLQQRIALLRGFWISCSANISDPNAIEKLEDGLFE